VDRNWTGITRTCGRLQPYTVWLRGFVICFTDELEQARIVLRKWAGSEYVDNLLDCIDTTNRAGV